MYFAQSVVSSQSPECVPNSQPNFQQGEFTIADVMAQLGRNGGKMDKITSFLERLESNMFSLKVENDKLKKDVEEMKKSAERTRTIC